MRRCWLGCSDRLRLSSPCGTFVPPCILFRGVLCGRPRLSAGAEAEDASESIEVDITGIHRRVQRRDCALSLPSSRSFSYCVVFFSLLLRLRGLARHPCYNYSTLSAETYVATFLIEGLHCWTPVVRLCPLVTFLVITFPVRRALLSCFRRLRPR